ncbi:hypothetical protein G6M89_11715 [Natronolimnobius sp. AArcel1]|uniref:hypothetical protein n=1 Tax=Natronolimnobius sp. AArcel1 TaxID=1679093 RepID=UPI0013EC70BC|nr:hypothetical protein [Natronolimnobius sp. AArcel1]NGM69665.1 hypothetical protein [Natronolimnobius sp. AArcel1]
MSEAIPLIYYGGLSVLFFFWIYGIVSFGLDLKNTIIPGIRQYRRGRKQLTEQQAAENDRTETEEQLY